MTTLSKNARIAGLLYVLLGAVAPWRLVYIPNTMLGGDVATVSASILAREALFRFGIVTDVLTGLMAIVLTLGLYRLFKNVDRNVAIAMVLLGGVIVGVLYFVNVVNDAGALLMAKGGSWSAGLDRVQRDAMVGLFIRLHQYGVRVNEVFWGLWLFPFGLLVYRSGFLPRFLGVLLYINGIAYVVLAFTGILAPQYENRLSDMLFPALVPELIVGFWLLIAGARERPSPVAAGVVSR